MRPRTWLSHVDAVWPVLAILLLPFGIFYWLVPLFSSLTIGNDYGVFPIQQQLELLFSQRTGTFPLYAPGFAEGRSQAALTMGQQFHPLPYLAALIPGYHDGHALQINTLLRLFSLGAAHLALFYLFRRLGLARLAAFLVTFLTVYNQRMLDCFRYGASLENHTAFLFLFASLGFLWHKPRHYAGPLLVACSTWLLCCGGHPQMMYLGFLGAGLICALIPFAFPAFADDPRPPWRDIRRYYLTCAAALLAGILLSAAYLASFYFEFIADNAARVGRDYAWSLIYTDTLGGLLNNFFAPLQSDVHGAFGSSALILLPLFILFIPTRRQMAPWAVVAFAVLAVLTVLIAAGDATPLHRWFWEYLPLANAFRVPGRIVFFLPALLAIPLAWLLRPVDTLTTRRGRTWPVSPLFLPALLALAAYLVYHFFFLDTLPPPGHFHPNRIHSAPAWLAPALFRLHLAALVLAVLYAIRLPFRPALLRTLTGLLLICAVLATGVLQLRHGTWVVAQKPSKTLAAFRAEKQQNIAFTGAPGFGMESPAVTRHMQRSAFNRQLARFYREALPASDNDEAYRRMARDRHPHAAVVEQLPAPISPPRTGDPAASAPDRIALRHATFNRFAFDVEAGAEGILSFALPYDGRWLAFRDGTPLPVYRANGLETAVHLPAGKHRIHFRYTSPATTWGALVATVTLCLLLTWFAFRAFAGRARWLVALVLSAAALLALGTWHRSLYHGPSLETHYVWTSADLPPWQNLAFAKPTRMSSIRSVQMPYFYYAGLGTDGARQGRPFLTNTEKKSRPWWQVDLGAPRDIGLIHIYDRGTGRRHLPLDVLVSVDGTRFRRHHQATERPRTATWQLHIPPVRARFVRLQSGVPGVLAYNEIEIYPPPPAPASP